MIKKNLPLSLVNPPNMTREISAQLSILNPGTQGQDLVNIRNQISHFIDQVSTEGNEERQSFSIRLVLMITQLYFSQNKLWLNFESGYLEFCKIDLHKQILDTWFKTNQDTELFRGRIQLMTKTAMTIPPGIRDVIILDHILLNIKPIVLQSRERTNLSGFAFQFLLCKITFKLNQKHGLVFQTIHSRM